MKVIKKYFEDVNGNISFEGMSIPPDTSNRHYKEMLLDIENGDAELETYAGSQRESDEVTEKTISEARSWRDKELSDMDIMMFRAQDGHGSAKASIASLRKYRNDLRDWPASADFPQTKPTNPN